MKICIISDWFSEKMGYAENCLPKALSELGHNVHLITSERQVYSTSKAYKETYQSFLGEPKVNPGTSDINGFTLHRLKSKKRRGSIRLAGLLELLNELHPDVIQTFDLIAHTSLVSAWYCTQNNAILFSSNHSTESSFPLAKNSLSIRFKRIKWFYRKWIFGRIVSIVSRHSYPPTIDCEKIAIKFMGLQKKKSKICPLGVDTFTFTPLKDGDLYTRDCNRERLGFHKNDIICIYTGRFTEAKDPLCLAKALDKLNRLGFGCFKGLFLGDGPQCEQIKSFPMCIAISFVPVNELPQYYQCADIAVWPKQESTSMLDAAACGLPVVVSDTVQAKERYEGHGFTYRESDCDSLANVLLKLKSSSKRKNLGEAGSQKIIKKYSWLKIAKYRVKDYEEFLVK